MAVAVKPIAQLLPVDGIRLATACAGIKTMSKDDLLLVEICETATTVAIFTQNQFSAAPVTLAKQHLSQSGSRYLLINSGNANAGTGTIGMNAAVSCCAAVADQASCLVEQVIPFSTGVIGEYLPVEKISAAVPNLLQKLQADYWLAAARAIMTTDTVAKGLSRQFQWQGKSVTITGIAKGSGMICPNMATMLAYIATDMAIPKDILQRVLQSAADKSFNRISVDGDTSTNDACVLIATGKSGVRCNADDAELLGVFRKALDEVCVELAQWIIRDGEGATKFITVDVQSGRTEQECLQAAYTIAHSPLVKTAFFASDPNWGRILAALGRAGIKDLDLDQIEIYLGTLCIVKGGARAPDYDEPKATAAMAQDEIHLTVHLNLGSASAKIWTNDLSYEYVRINAAYRS